MSKFKVGDVVVAKEDSPYNMIIQEGWIGKVRYIQDNGMIEVESPEDGFIHLVNEKYFDIYVGASKPYDVSKVMGLINNKNENKRSLSENVEMHRNICESLTDIYEKKNHDYGGSFHATFLEEGMSMPRIRLSDKLNRFKSLTKDGSQQKVNDESIEDTLLDLANYAIMTVIEMRRAKDGSK